MDLPAAIKKMKESEYKTTRVRQAMLESMFAQRKPFSANALLAALSKKSPRSKPDVVTIYRNLTIFEDLGIISRCDFNDDEVNYEIATGDHAHHHHHIVCKRCKKVEALDFCFVQGQEQILEKLGYKEVAHRLEFLGLCPDCASRR